MNEPKRRNDDLRFIGRNKTLIGLVCTLLAAVAFVFTTFTTYRYVDHQFEQSYKYMDVRMAGMDERMARIDDNTQKILDAIKMNDKKLDELKKELR